MKNWTKHHEIFRIVRRFHDIIELPKIKTKPYLRSPIANHLTVARKNETLKSYTNALISRITTTRCSVFTCNKLMLRI